MAGKQDAKREALSTVESFQTRIAVIQLLVSAYLGNDLDEETFLSDFRVMLPEQGAISASGWVKHLPSEVCDEMLGVVSELEREVLPEVLRYARESRRPQAASPGPTAIRRRLLALDERLARVHQLIVQSDEVD